MLRDVGRSTLALLLLLAVPLTAAAQQRPDKEFNTKVANPMFGAKNHPVLLVDQGHNNTHTTRGRYDVVASLAASDGFDVMVDGNPFTVNDLKDANILLVANALGALNFAHSNAGDPAFTAKECDALYQWVSGGGSLLLIAEHPPMGNAAKNLGKRFGVDFSTGYLADPALADTAFGLSTLVFSQATHTLGDHPIMRGRGPNEVIKKVRTYTGQSFSVPEGATALLKVTDKAQDFMLGTAGVKGTVPDSLKRSAAGRAQAIAFTVGKGRVVMIGEATLFSAQLVQYPGEARKVGMNSPGFDNRQLCLNVLRWLARGLN